MGKSGKHNSMIRTGIGYDTHKLVKGNNLVVGGVSIPSNYKSLGHSDGDSLLMVPESNWFGSVSITVFVSDEDEQSTMEYPAVSDFMSWYQSQRMGSVFMASIINVEPEDSLCGGWTPTLYVGKRYREATSLR